MPPSEQAQARKQKFREAKAQHGGIQALIDNQTHQPSQLWFNSTGTIVAYGPHVDPRPDWITHDFTPQELRFIDYPGVNLGRYEVAINEHGQYQIQFRKAAEYVDILPGIQPVKLVDHAAVHIDTSEQSGIQICDATQIPEIGSLLVSITSQGDPHWVYHSEVISLAHLRSQSWHDLKYTVTGRHSVYVNRQPFTVSWRQYEKNTR